MFIFFDLDDTLVNHTRAANAASLNFYDHFRNTLPYAREKFPEIWIEVMERHFEKFIRGEITFNGQQRDRMREIFNSAFLTGEQADVFFKVYMDKYEAEWTLFDDVLPCLENFTKTNLGIITNGAVEQQEKKLKKLGLFDKFSVIAISEALGVRKPDPEIFIEACRLAHVKLEDAAYIGDRLEHDAVASKAVGMKGIWLNRTHQPESSSGVAVIHSLKDLKLNRS